VTVVAGVGSVRVGASEALLHTFESESKESAAS